MPEHVLGCNPLDFKFSLAKILLPVKTRDGDTFEGARAFINQHQQNHGARHFRDRSGPSPNRAGDP